MSDLVSYSLLHSNLTNCFTEETAMDLNKKFGTKIPNYVLQQKFPALTGFGLSNIFFFFQIHQSQLCLIRCSKCITEEENICCFGLAQSGIVLKLR